MHDYDTLIETILTTVEPETWEAVGGPGSIKPFYPSAVLVVSQTEDVHRRILPLVEILRTAGRAQGLTGKTVSLPQYETPPPDRSQQRVYVSAPGWTNPLTVTSTLTGGQLLSGESSLARDVSSANADRRYAATGAPGEPCPGVAPGPSSGSTAM